MHRNLNARHSHDDRHTDDTVCGLKITWMGSTRGNMYFQLLLLVTFASVLMVGSDIANKVGVD